MPLTVRSAGSVTASSAMSMASKGSRLVMRRTTMASTRRVSSPSAAGASPPPIIAFNRSQSPIVGSEASRVADAGEPLT